MTAFLFIPPTTAGAPIGRRVDFGNIGSLFAETEEPAPRPKNQTAKIGMIILVLLGVVGDALLVTHPDALASDLGVHAAPATHQAA